MSEYKNMVSEGVKKVKFWTKRAFLIIVGVAILGGVLYLVVMNMSYSEGTRSGILLKISRKGYVFKTYEGQLNIGGLQFSNPASSISNIWDFSVSSDAVYDSLQKYEGKNVKVHYRERYKAMPWQGETNYFITKVEPIK